MLEYFKENLEQHMKNERSLILHNLARQGGILLLELGLLRREISS